MSEEAVVDVVSQLGPTGVPIYGTCSLRLGDGSAAVEFRDGRAQVPAYVAAMLVGRKDIAVLGNPVEWVPPEMVPPDAEPDLEYVIPGAQDDPPPNLGVPASVEDIAREAARVAALEDGADVPTFPIPSGFATHTESGDHRCLAAKGDGTQCANGAKPETWACGLEKHQQQVAALPPSLP